MTNEKTEKLAELIVNTGRLIHRKTGSFGIGKVSMLRFKLLQFISEKSNPTMKDIADFLGVAPPTATVIARCLIRSGAIRREQTNGDRRVIRMKITPRGKKTINDTRAQILKTLHPMLDNLTKKEIIALTSILNKIISHYEK